MTTPPRSAVTLVVRVANTGKEAVHADLKLALPGGWRQLIDDGPVRLEPGMATVRILSIFAPQEAPAGDHTVGVAAMDVLTGTILEQVTLGVRVLPYLEMRLDALDGSTLVVAGEQIVFPFRLANQSNTELAISLEATSRSAYPARFEGTAGEPVLLGPGESRRLVAVVQTPEVVGRVETHQLTVTATGVPTAADGDVKANLRAKTQIIPAVSEEPAALNTVPARLGLSTSHTFSDEWRGFLRADFSGGGYLDAERLRRLEFQIAPSLPLHEPGFGDPRDVYRVNYEGEHLELMLGDNRYVVSPLLGPGLSGRGVFARTTLDGFRLGGLAYYPRTGSPLDSTVGALFDYTVPQLFESDDYRYRASANLLSRPGEYLTFGTHHDYHFAGPTAIEGEIAFGAEAGEPLAPAVMAGATGVVSDIELAATARFGAPGFPGPFGDRLSVNGSAATYVGSGDTRITGNVLFDRQNLQRSAVNTRAPQTVSVGLGTRLPLGTPGSSFTAGLRYRSRKDMTDAPTMDQGVSSLTTSTRLPLGSLRLGLNTSHDAERDALRDAWLFAQRYSLSAAFVRSSASSHSVAVAVSDRRGERVTNTGSYGVALATEQKREALSTMFRTSLTLSTAASREPDLALGLSNRTDLKVRRSHVLSVNASLRAARTASDWRLSGGLTLEYTIPLRVPVSRPQGLGSVLGTVYNAETGEPATDIVIRMANRAVITGPEGQFRFSGVAPGEYHLQMDTSRLAGRLIPALPLPILVGVEADEVTELDIPVVRSARVSGEIRLYALPEGQEGLLQRALAATNGEYDLADLVPAGVLVRALVELRNGIEIRRVISDRDGRFDFTDLRPGQWTARLSSTQIPRFHRVVQDEITFTVLPGGTERLVFEVAPMRRPVTLLQSSVAPLELTLPPVVEAGPEPVKTSEPTPPDPGALLEQALQRYAEPDLNAPRLLGLPWGSSVDAVAEMLADRAGAITPVDDAPVRVAGEPAQLRTLRATGIFQLGLAGEVDLTFLEPDGGGTELFLVGVAVSIDGHANALSGPQTQRMFRDLLGLFTGKWKIEHMDVETDDTIESWYVHAHGIDVHYTYSESGLGFILDYRDVWFGEWANDQVSLNE